jgi:hypothetical protein
MQMLEQEGDLTKKQQASLLSLTRASLYYKAVEVTQEEIKIKHRIDDDFLMMIF